MKLQKNNLFTATVESSLNPHLSYPIDMEIKVLEFGVNGEWLQVIGKKKGKNKPYVTLLRGVYSNVKPITP